jgi:hypothetical protein
MLPIGSAHSKTSWAASHVNGRTVPRLVFPTLDQPIGTAPELELELELVLAQAPALPLLLILMLMRALAEPVSIAESPR